MRSILFYSLLLTCATVSWQVPNFGTTVGEQKLYGYSSMKYRAKADTWETYSALLYDIGNHFQTDVGLYANGAANYIGYFVRVGTKINDFLKIGAQQTPSFDLNDHHKFSYLTSAHRSKLQYFFASNNRVYQKWSPF